MLPGVGAAARSLPIGILDSGVGGLSILNELRKTLPQESFIYFGDTANAPYGSREERDISALIFRAASALVQRGLKALVLGSSTVTSVGLADLRSCYTLPIIGTSPSVRRAVEASRSCVVGVLATQVTARSNLLKNLIDECATPANVQVMLAWHNDLVPLIERGEVNTPAVRAVLEKVLRPLASAGADQLVLGSTHFSFLRPAIRAQFGDMFACVDSAETVARELDRVLDEHQLKQRDTAPGSVLLLFTGNLDEARAVVGSLLPDADPNRSTKLAIKAATAAPRPVRGP